MNRLHPFGLPPGTVRAALAVGIVASYLSGGPADRELVLFVLGFYFVTRGRA